MSSDCTHDPGSGRESSGGTSRPVRPLCLFYATFYDCVHKGAQILYTRNQFSDPSLSRQSRVSIVSPQESAALSAPAYPRARPPQAALYRSLQSMIKEQPRPREGSRDGKNLPHRSAREDPKKTKSSTSTASWHDTNGHFIKWHWTSVSV